TDGAIKDHLPFVRTAKGGNGRRPTEFQAFWEAILGGLLVIGAIVLVAANQQQVREIYIFAAVLVVQSLPFLSAVGIAALEGSPLTHFGSGGPSGARFANSLPRRAVTKAPAPADKRVETAP